MNDNIYILAVLVKKNRDVFNSFPIRPVFSTERNSSGSEFRNVGRDRQTPGDQTRPFLVNARHVE